MDVGNTQMVETRIASSFGEVTPFIQRSCQIFELTRFRLHPSD